MPVSDYIVTIGLEVHCQIKTESKMFCSCRNGFGYDPNANVCPVCMGLPGALPVLNKHAIEKTILAGLMLGCSNPPVSKWDRKNYFYPDMPKDYQTSQYDLPLCIGGTVPLYPLAYSKEAQKNIKNPGKAVKLNRIHLEEDAGKLTHYPNYSLLDFNRTGTPLMEIVTEPDIDDPEEAYAYLKSLQQILIYGGISDADMEKGQMRCDVNVSLRPIGQKELGEKVELKNINSMSAVRNVLYFEIKRQAEELDMGIPQIQSTRRWDADLGESILMRTKESAHDYRYFPCPDLLPVHTAPYVEAMAPLVPELPDQKSARFIEQYGVSEYDANVLTSEQALANFFEKAAGNSPHGKKIANWILNTLLGALNEEGLSITESPLPPETITGLVDIMEEGIVSNNQAREVYSLLRQEPSLTPAEAAKKLGFEKTDSSALDEWVEAAIASNPAKVQEIVDGNEKLLNWLTGQVMKQAAGKANPKLVTEALRKRLGL